MAIVSAPVPTAESGGKAIAFVPAMLQALGRHGPVLLFGIIAASLFAPGPSAFAAHHVRVAAFLLTLGSCLAAALSPPERLKERAALTAALIFAGALVPFMTLGFLRVVDLQPSIALALMIAALAPPAGSSAAIATILGLRPRLALVVSLFLTFAAPVTMPAAMAAFGLDVAVDFKPVTVRLLAIVGGSIVVTWVFIRCRNWSRHVVPDARAASGIAVLGMLMVGLAVADGIAVLLADPDRLMRLLALCLAMNLAIALMGAVAFAAMGIRVGLTIGLLGGNRNVTLAWAVAGASLPADAQAYLALCLVPIFAQPLLLQLAFSLSGAVMERLARRRARRELTAKAMANPAEASAASENAGLPALLWIAVFFLLPPVCELAAKAIGIAVPGAVAGFCLLLLLLAWRGRVSDQVSELAQGLIRWLPVVVVAPMVGIFDSTALRAGEWIAIACGVVAGVVTTLLVTGFVVRGMLARRDARAGIGGDRAGRE